MAGVLALFPGAAVILVIVPSLRGAGPLVVQMLGEQLGGLKETGLTMILAEQNVHFVSELGDRVYVLEKGMVGYQGSMAAFLANEEIRRPHLAV